MLTMIELKNRKTTLLIASSAFATHYSLSHFLQQEDHHTATGGTSPKESLSTSAEQATVSGFDSLHNGDLEAAASELSRARELHEQAGDAKRADQITNQLDLVEHELSSQEKQQESPPARGYPGSASPPS